MTVTLAPQSSNLDRRLDTFGLRMHEQQLEHAQLGHVPSLCIPLRAPGGLPSRTPSTQSRMPVKAQALAVGAQVMGTNPLSTSLIAGVFGQLQDTDLELVLTIANSDNFTAATTEDIVTQVANHERRSWKVHSKGRSCTLNLRCDGIVNKERELQPVEPAGQSSDLQCAHQV